MNEAWKRLAADLAGSGHGLIVTDQQGHVVYLNAAVERLTGCANQEVVGQPLAALAQKAAQETLRQVFELRQLALDAAELGTWDFDVGSDTGSGDERFRAMHGLPDGPISNHTFLETVHPDDRAALLCAQQAALDPALEGRYDVEYRVLHADGRVRWVTLKGRAAFRDEGETRRAIHVVGTARDITAGKEAEHALREALELRQIALDTAELGTWDSDPRDPQGLSCAGDARCQAILGASPTRSRHEDFLHCVHPDDRQHADRAVAMALDPKSDGRYSAEYRVLLADGTVRWVAAKGATFFEGEGESRRAVRGIGTVMDITARKEAELALHEAIELRQMALDAAEMGTWEWYPGSLDCVIDLRCQQILGFAGQRLTFERFLEVVHPEDRQRVAVANWASCNPTSDGRYDADYRVLRADGALRWVAARGQAFFDGEGQSRRAVRVVGTLMDITERKRAEDELRSREQLLRAFFDNLTVGTAQVDLDGNFLEVNDRYCQITGYSRDVLLTMNRRDLIHPDDWPADQVKLVPLHQGQLPSCEVEQRYVRKDGAVIWVQVYRALLRAADGRPLRVAGVVQDITARKEAEIAAEAARRSAEQAKAAAEAANQAKSQFLAHMSHELRTPMNSILGMTELVLQEPLTPMIRDCLQTVKDSADTLLVLINEVLDLSRIEAGALLLDAKPFRLRPLLDDALKAVALRASEKGLQLACHAAPDVPEWLVGDALRLRQILVNLLGNAVKFTERGEVVLRVSLESARAEQARLRFAVSDTGIGIASEDQVRIFAPFTQADPSSTRRFGGSGLGLAIVSRLVDMLGGQVELESQLGKGSTFSFTVAFLEKPISPSGVAPAIAQAVEGTAREGMTPRYPSTQTAARSLRVLLAEDTPANQKLAVRILSRRGHVVEVAQNGLEAVQRLSAAPFDVVLMDVQMPVMDGFQATGEIRRLRLPAKARIPIIAMTAHALKGDQERCLAAGMDAYISKPIDSQELIALVERLPGGTPDAP
jgi:PAS domain S-box-containing protein